MSAQSPTLGLTRAIAATQELIAGVGADEWSAPSPCDDWDVRAVVNHLVFGNILFAGILRGDHAPDKDELRRLRDADHLGADPLAAYMESGASLEAAFAPADVLGTAFASPLGQTPGAVLLVLRINEMLVHGWDVAVATGQSRDGLPSDLAVLVLDRLRAQLSGSPRGVMFAEPQPADDSLPAIDQLAAYLGRSIPAS